MEVDNAREQQLHWPNDWSMLGYGTNGLCDCTLNCASPFICKSVNTNLFWQIILTDCLESNNVHSWDGNISKAWNILPWMAHCWHSRQRNNCLQGWQRLWGPDGDSWLLFIISLRASLHSPFSQPPLTPGEIHGKPWDRCVHLLLQLVISLVCL